MRTSTAVESKLGRPGGKVVKKTCRYLNFAFVVCNDL